MNSSAEFDEHIRETALMTAQQALAEGRAVTLAAGGLSMGASWTGAESVTINPVPRRITRGTVVVFARDDLWVAHRVIGFDHTAKDLQYLTKGDGVGKMDYPPVRSSELIGVVITVRHIDGSVSTQTPMRKMFHWFRSVIGLRISRIWRVIHQVES